MEPLLQTHHVFVDFENVHEVDLAVISHEAVVFNLLIGPQKRKLDTDLVEALLENAASVNLIRLAASGRNALDFALAYYLGRACTADPRGRFHLISKDTGYDPLLVHLRSNNIDAQRHDDFSTLPFLPPAPPKAKPAPKPKAPVKPRARATPAVSPVAKPAPLSPKPAGPIQASKPAPLPAPKPASRAVKPALPAVPPGEEENLTVLALNRLITNDPQNPKSIARLKSYLKDQLGQKITEFEADIIIKDLTRDGIIKVEPSGKVVYHLDPDSPPPY